MATNNNNNCFTLIVDVIKLSLVFLINPILVPIYYILLNAFALMSLIEKYKSQTKNRKECLFFIVIYWLKVTMAISITMMWGSIALYIIIMILYVITFVVVVKSNNK